MGTRANIVSVRLAPPHLLRDEPPTLRFSACGRGAWTARAMSLWTCRYTSGVRRGWGMMTVLLALVACTSPTPTAGDSVIPSVASTPTQPTPSALTASPPAVNPSDFPGGTHGSLKGPRFWFADALHGWGVDGDCNAPIGAATDACAFQAVMTSDGGKSWAPVGGQQAFTYKTVGPYDGALMGFVAADAQAGWLLGSNPVVTHDGGISWAAESLPANVTNPEPVPGGAWALAGACADGNCVPSLYRQTSGSWVRVPPPPGETSASQLVATSVGVAFVLNPSTDGSSPGTSAVSTNGGSSWQQLTLPCGGTGLTASTDQSLWLWCEDQPTTSQQSGQLFRSRDGARHWTLVVDNAPAVFGAAGPAGRHTLGNLPTVGYQQDLLALANGALYLSRDKFGLVARSLDGGTHWIPLLGDDGAGGYRIEFADTKAGWAASGGCLFRTTDAGDHWSLMKSNSARTIPCTTSSPGAG